MKKTNEIIKEKYLKDKKGITLIALVITIVLMLILATVTVNVVIDGGLFEYASDAKRNTDLAREKEDLQKSVIIAEGTSKTGRITVNDMQKALNKIVTDENGTTVIDNGDTLVVKYNKSNRYYEIYNNGKVEGPKQLIKEEYAGDITRGGNCDGSSLEKAFQITCIEDLVAFSIMSNGGDSKLNLSSSVFEDKYIKLTRTLDFKSIFSYNDYTATMYGDLNKDGKKEDIRTELIKTEKGCIGFTGINNFQGIFDGQGYQIRNIYANANGNAGLFLKVNNATIQNLTITGEITATREAGGIASGDLGTRNNTFINCSNYASVTGSKGVGGILRGWNV